MVSDSRFPGLSDDRAQLILVGSLAVAIVIIGLTVLINTVLFTESVGSSSLDNRIDESTEYDAEVVQGVRQLTFRIGHGNRNLTEAELRGHVADNVTRYSRAVAESYAASRPVAVSVEYSNDSVVGNRTLQSTDSNITSVSNAEDWTPISDKTVGWFTLNVNVGETTQDKFYVNATNTTSGRWVNLSINRTDGGNVSVESTVNFRPNDQATCTSVDGRVLLNVYSGEALTDSTSDCTFNGTRLLEEPYSISFENGDNLVGKYSIVTREEVSLPPCHANPDPCRAPVLWMTRITTSFDGESINYENTYNVSIYGDSFAPPAPTGGVLDNDSTVVTNESATEGDGGTTFDFNFPNADALGSSGDIDGDNRMEIPYITGSTGDLVVNDSDGNVETLIDRSDGSISDAEKPDRDKTLMATTSWNGSGTAVFYSNKNDNKIYRISSGGSPTLVKHLSSDGVNSVLGSGDVDGDGDDELVYAGSSQAIRYIEPDGSLGGAMFSNTGQNNGIGNGPLPDFDGDGVDSAIVVDGSNDIRLINDTAGTFYRPAQSSVDAAKSPATAADVDDDGDFEIVYVDLSTNNLRYIDDVGGSPTVEVMRDESGNPIPANDETGVVS